MKYKRREEGNRETIIFFYMVLLKNTLLFSLLHMAILIQTDKCTAGNSGEKKVYGV